MPYTQADQSGRKLEMSMLTQEQRKASQAEGEEAAGAAAAGAAAAADSGRGQVQLGL